MKKETLFRLIEEVMNEDCWDGYKRDYDVPKGDPGSCEKNTDESQLEEAEICAKGKNYVDGKTIGGQKVSRGKDGKFNNWSARAAQIASKYCKDPNYGKGRGKDAKNEEVTPEEEEELKDVSKQLDGAVKAHRNQSKTIKKALKNEQKKNCGCGQNPCKTYGLQEGEGGLKAWGEKENWTHSDGTPCGGGDKDGSQSRCKPAAKWKTMSKSEKAADNAKKKAGTKKGQQYVPATKKGKVTKAYTKRNEGIERKIKVKIKKGLDEKKKKPCKPSKGKRFAKRVDGKCRSFGQKGQAKGGGDRIRPGTKKGDAYCARSAKIKKCKNPPCANALSRKKWKCRGSKSMK
jgi:hypothetical protein